MKIQREMTPPIIQQQPQNPQQPQIQQQNPQTPEQPSIAREASMNSTSSYNDPPDMNWDWNNIVGDQLSPQTTPTSSRTYAPRTNVRTPEIAQATFQEAAVTPPRTATPEMETTGRRPRVQKGTYFESPPEKTTSKRGKGQARQPKPRKD